MAMFISHVAFTVYGNQCSSVEGFCRWFQGKIYVFDRVFRANSAQDTVYTVTAMPIVKGNILCTLRALKMLVFLGGLGCHSGVIQLVGWCLVIGGHKPPDITPRWPLGQNPPISGKAVRNPQDITPSGHNPV